jgi:hypothetical protein
MSTVAITFCRSSWLSVAGDALFIGYLSLNASFVGAMDAMVCKR